MNHDPSQGLGTSRVLLYLFAGSVYLYCDVYNYYNSLEGEEVKRVKTFKYLGSQLAEEGELDAEVNQSGWRNWKKVSGVLCDRRMKVKIKGKVCQTIVRPAMVYGHGQ